MKEKQPPKGIVLDIIRAGNYRALQQREGIVWRALQVMGDPEAKKRRDEGKCPVCYYINRGRLAGQAFTEWKCLCCHKEDMHSNTAVPKICAECSADYDMCRDCGADLELRERAKAVRRRHRVR